MSYQRTKLKCLLSSAALAVTSEALLWLACNGYGKMIDNDEWNTLGYLTFIFHLPGQILRDTLFPSYPASDTYGTQLILTNGAVQFLVVYWCLLRVGSYMRHAVGATRSFETTEGEVNSGTPSGVQ